MEHPFIQSSELKSKTLDELQKVMTSLTTKLNFAYRTANRPLISQLEMALESHRNAYLFKMDEMMEKKNLKDKIKINE